MKNLPAVLVACLLAVPLAAADVDGKWKAEVSATDSRVFEFQVKEGVLPGAESSYELTGAVSYGTEPAPIQDGKIDGDLITFKVVDVPNPYGFEVTHLYRGTLSGDEIAFVQSLPRRSSSRTRRGRPTRSSRPFRARSFIAKRVE